MVKEIFEKYDIPLKDFQKMISKEKKSLKTIKDLRNMWTHNVYGKVMRIMSNIYFRKMSLKHIFNSRITGY